MPIQFTLTGIFASASLASLVVATPSPIEQRSGTKLTHAQATAKLTAGNVAWTSSGGCSDKTNPTCTSFDGVYSGTIDGVVLLRSSAACGCAVTVTGGTETGHASGTYSHANGYKLDLSKTTALNNYITTRFTRIANRGDGYAQYQAASGNIYCDEGNHWDVTYY